MEFKVKAANQRQGIETLAYITARTTLQMQNLIPRILFLGGGAALAILKGILPWSGKLASYETFCIITGITLMLLGIWGDQINRWNAWRLARRNLTETILTFGEKYLEIVQEGTVRRCNYADLYAVYHVDGAFVVYLTAKEGYLFYESDFQEGAASLLPDFLERKREKPVEVLQIKLPRM